MLFFNRIAAFAINLDSNPSQVHQKFRDIQNHREPTNIISNFQHDNSFPRRNLHRRLYPRSFPEFKSILYNCFCL